jgi:hypothetical protein
MAGFGAGKRVLDYGWIKAFGILVSVFEEGA